jgi:hypothetical protein
MDPAWSQVKCRVTGDSQLVVGDAELLKVVLQNLLLNALHAMGGRGEVAVVIERNGGIVHLDVVDSGSGIPAAAVPRLFTPFFTTKASGTGWDSRQRGESRGPTAGTLMWWRRARWARRSGSACPGTSRRAGLRENTKHACATRPRR